MLLHTFLETVVPSGLVVVARMVTRKRDDGTPFKVFRHYICEDHQQAVETIQQLCGEGHDVYYALASYKQGFHLNAKGKKVVRVRENVDQVKALWLDIDFKGTYTDLPAAAKALVGFLQQTKMPGPSIVVGSGHGIHVYWPFDTAIPVDRWQRLSDSLKGAAKAFELDADLVCTADACRVLRPPGTTNFKDPSNPKAVTILNSNGKLHDVDELETALLPWAPAAAARRVTGGVNDELTGGVGVKANPAQFELIAKNCAVSKWVLETNGKLCTEPEWVSVLQLLKHCEDGAMYYHEVSKGHPGYDPQSTEEKWAARQHNTAGPTLCKTFEAFRPGMCATCPHAGFVKTPLQVGHPGVGDAIGLPAGWRYAEDDGGVERLMIVDAGDGQKSKEWIKQFSYIPLSLRLMKSTSGEHDMEVNFKLRNTDVWSVNLSTASLGNQRKLQEQLALYAVVLKPKEIGPFGELMSTWLKKLQSARRVADVTSQLGWIEVGGSITGFACSPTVYHADGRVRDDVRPSREFATLAKLYEPRGGLEEWKQVAQFITEQDNPAFTAVLAAAFGAPLLKFTGMEGAILSLVSTASGVGKSSALRLSQSVWGSPVHGMSSVDDTHKSVAKKAGFLHNLPIYWDEIRGKQSLDGFCQLGYMITQGRDKDRLTQSSEFKGGQSWQTMAAVASNESIFNAMAQRSTGSDAGMVRVFEIEMSETPKSDRKSAEITLLFESLSRNYGHAGRIYAQYLATHSAEVSELVRKVYLELASDNMSPAERFWFGVMAILLVGASLARKLELANINLKSLREFLMQNLNHLRARTAANAVEGGPSEVIAAYLRDRGNATLIIDEFHDIHIAEKTGKVTVLRGRPKADYLPQIIDPPRSGKMQVVLASNQKRIRFAHKDLHDWLVQRQVNVYGFFDKLVKETGARQFKSTLGYRTTYEGPRVRLLEIDLSAAGSWSPDEIRDSSSETEPED